MFRRSLAQLAKHCILLLCSWLGTHEIIYILFLYEYTKYMYEYQNIPVFAAGWQAWPEPQVH